MSGASKIAKSKGLKNSFPIKGDPNYVDHLKEDPPIVGQGWFLATFIHPENVRNTTLRGMKIREFFATKEDAEKKAPYYRELDEGKFDVLVGEVGKWLPIKPETDDIKNQIYAESELNDIVAERDKQAVKVKKEHEARKQELKSKQNDNKRRTEMRERLRAKLEEKKKAPVSLPVQEGYVNSSMIRNELTEQKERKNAEEKSQPLRSLNDAIERHDEYYERCDERQSIPSLNDGLLREIDNKSSSEGQDFDPTLKAEEKELERRSKILEEQADMLKKERSNVTNLVKTVEDINKLSNNESSNYESPQIKKLKEMYKQAKNN